MSDGQLANAEDCRPLLDLMEQVRELAPWDWMEESDLFGVQHPQTGERFFVSVMGSAGEHFAIAAYRDARGLYGFHRMREMYPFITAEDALNTPQLQASFEDQEMLEAHDQALLEGLDTAGRTQWPQFRSYRTGSAPWYLEKDEADALKLVLEQLLIVAPKVKDDPDWLAQEGENSYRVRVLRDGGWDDEVQTVDEPENTSMSIELSEDTYNAVKKLTRGSFTLEIDFFLLPQRVGAPDERPYFPYMLLLVNTTSNQVVGYEVLAPLPSLAHLWGQLAPTVLQQLVKIGKLPDRIRIRDERLYGMLMLFKDEFGLKIKHVEDLPKLDRARAELEAHLREQAGG